MGKGILFKRMRQNSFFVVGFAVALFIILAILLIPFFSKFDPKANSLTSIFRPPDGFSQGLSGHILGTDELGRDVFTRLIYGGRYSLFIAATVVLLQVLVGTTLGIVAGYFGGIFDMIIMRLCDIVLTIPNLILAIAIMAVMGVNLTNLILVLTFAGWVDCCKITRNNVMIIKGQEFVHASKVLGAKNGHIMFTQILPNVTTHIIILASQRFGLTILAEAALSFLNLGIQPPTPSWGNMIAGGRSFMTIYPWLVFAPGIALMLCVLAFNFLGDGLRDVLDPKRQ
jgi:ABC-type dipeptide/oligopeptide/nickel transport systems, permease components